MQEHLYEQFYSDGHNGFLEDATVTLINKTDGKDPKIRENYLMRTLKMLALDGIIIQDQILYIPHIIIYKVNNPLGHELN